MWSEFIPEVPVVFILMSKDKQKEDLLVKILFEIIPVNDEKYNYIITAKRNINDMLKTMLTDWNIGLYLENTDELINSLHDFFVKKDARLIADMVVNSLSLAILPSYSIVYGINSVKEVSNLSLYSGDYNIIKICYDDGNISKSQKLIFDVILNEEDFENVETLKDNLHKVIFDS